MSKLVKIGKVARETKSAGFSVVRIADGATTKAVCTTTNGQQVTAYKAITPGLDGNFRSCQTL